MPKKKLQVMVSEETYRAVEAYAVATGTSLSSAVAHLLDEAAPTLLQMSEAMSKARSAPARAIKDATRALDKAVHEAEQVRMDFEEVRPRRKKRS